MKKHILFLSFSIISSIVYTQSWTNSNVLFGDNNVIEIQSTIDVTGNIYSIGYFTSTVETNSGLILNTF